MAQRSLISVEAVTQEEWKSLRSQFVILKTGRGQHRKYVFTEHGAFMLASVRSQLRSATESPAAFGIRAVRQPRKTTDDRACLLLGQAEFIQLLEVQPELGTGPEKVSESQGAVPADGSLAIQYPGNPVSRHFELPSEFGRTHGKLPELLGEMFSWVNRASCHTVFLSDNQQSRH